MPAGRPTKYLKKYCKELINFFTVELYTIIEIPHYQKDGSLHWVDYRKEANPLPTFEKFAQKINVNVTTLIEWSKKHEEFSKAYVRAKELQKNHLIQNGMNGLYNPGFTQFVAQNITDMKNVQKHEHTGEDGGPIRFHDMSDDELREFIKS